MARFLVLLLYWASFQAVAEELVPAKIEEISPREDFRKKLFAESLAKRACKVISKNPSGVVSENPALTNTLQKLLDALNKSSPTDLAPLFHPQLKVRTKQVAVALTSISRISGKNVQASLFRAYAINNPDGDPQPTECVEDGLMVRPLYGHRVQVAVWIQAQGADEISRIYADLVPTKDAWLIGAWNVQQWTHAGQDYNEWRAKAQKSVESKQAVAGWIFYDIAIKLLDGGKFLSFPVEKDIAVEQAKVLSGKTLLESLTPKFPSEKLVYVSSLFSRHGAGLLLRFGLESEWSANAIREHCRAKYRQLLDDGLARDLAGIRCDYILPKESTTKEGVLGGIFVDQASLKTK